MQLFQENPAKKSRVEVGQISMEKNHREGTSLSSTALSFQKSTALQGVPSREGTKSCLKNSKIFIVTKRAQRKDFIQDFSRRRPKEKSSKNLTR